MKCLPSRSRLLNSNDWNIDLQAKLRVFDSVWSSSFSLDTVGSSGVVICKDEDHDRTYQVISVSCYLKEIVSEDSRKEQESKLFALR